MHAVAGSINIAVPNPLQTHQNITSKLRAHLLELIGKSLAFPGTNAFIGSPHGAEILTCIAPPWAELIAADVRDVAEVQQLLWRHASLPVSRWPAPHQRATEANGRVDADGMVHLVERPDDMLVMVCGGLGNLHALALHSFGPTKAVTRGF